MKGFFLTIFVIFLSVWTIFNVLFIVFFERHTIKVSGEERTVYLYVVKDKTEFNFDNKYQRKFDYVVKDGSTPCYQVPNEGFHISFSSFSYGDYVSVSVKNFNKLNKKSFLQKIILNNNKEDAEKIFQNIFYQIDIQRHPEFYPDGKLPAEKDLH